MQCRGRDNLGDHQVGRSNYASSMLPGLNRADPTPAALRSYKNSMSSHVCARCCVVLL